MKSRFEKIYITEKYSEKTIVKNEKKQTIIHSAFDSAFFRWLT